MEHTPCDNPLCDQCFETIDDGPTGYLENNEYEQYVHQQELRNNIGTEFSRNKCSNGETGFVCTMCAGIDTILAGCGNVFLDLIGVVLTPTGTVTNIKAPN